MTEKQPSTIYIVGGLPRTGKTLLAKELARSMDIDCLETDHIRMLFNADPQSPIGYVAEKDIAKCTKSMRPYLESFISGMVQSCTSVVINGETIQPKMIAKSPHKEQIKACFLGLNDPDAAYERLRAQENPHCWTHRFSDDDLRALLYKYAARSDDIKQACDKFGIDYFDASSNVFETQEEAYRRLTLGSVATSSLAAVQ